MKNFRDGSVARLSDHLPAFGFVARISMVTLTRLMQLAADRVLREKGFVYSRWPIAAQVTVGSVL